MLLNKCTLTNPVYDRVSLKQILAGLFCLLLTTASGVFGQAIISDPATVEQLMTHGEVTCDTANGSASQIRAEQRLTILGSSEFPNSLLQAQLQSIRTIACPVSRNGAFAELVDTPVALSMPCTAAIALEQAETAYDSGLFSAALEGYTSALECLENCEPTEVTDALTNSALVGRAGILARVGRMNELQALFDSMEGRAVTGRSGQILRNAREGLHMMRYQPDLAFMCGPIALQSIYKQMHGRPHADLHSEASTTKGVSLARLDTLSRQVGLELQIAFREPGAPLMSPAVIHWGLNHYAAILEERNGKYHVVDPTFAEDFWMSAVAIDAEASGYFMVPVGDLPTGWRTVTTEEAETVWGRGAVRARNTNSTRRSDSRTPQNRSGCGMAAYSAHLHMVSLNITDIPLAYTPPYGPEVAFELNYVERDISHLDTPLYGHMGPQWLYRFHSFLEFSLDTAANIHTATVTLPGGGRDTYMFEDASPDFAPPAQGGVVGLPSELNPETGTRLQAIYLSENGQPWELYLYRLLFPDGTFYTYDATALQGTRLYLSSITDTRGINSSLQFGYSELPSGAQRLETITDAAGGVSHLLYVDRLSEFPELDFNPSTTDPLRIIGFLDAAGRHAKIHYDAAGRLERIVDAVGIESIMAYDGDTDEIVGLTTPYGTSTFRRGSVEDDPNIFGWLEMEDALGRVERLEYTQHAPGVSPVDVNAPDAEQVLIRTRFSRQYRNTFYWDHQGWSMHPGDYTYAHIYQWLHDEMYALSTGVLESYKAPLESRVYYNYPGMTEPEDATLADMATLLFPSKIARVADDGSTWLETTDYNTMANVTREVDAAGRTVEIAYEPSVLLTPADIRPGSVRIADKEVAVYTYDNDQLPLLPTGVELAGEAPITLTYNSVGQPLTMTQDGDTFTYTYDQPDGVDGTKGNLLSVAAPANLGVLASFTYDAVNRVRTYTDAVGLKYTFDYDDLDRLVQTTFPDGSTEVSDYGGRLYPESLFDRLGRLTTWEYDDAGQLIAQTDWGVPTEAALQGVGAETTRYEWCDCGSLKALIDPAGNRTEWEHDVLGRVTEKQFANGQRRRYEYTPNLGRLARETKPDDVEISYTYAPVGDLLAVDFSDGSTPGLRYGYNTDFGWLETVSNVEPSTETILETVTYTYGDYADTVGAAAAGAGLLKTETGVLPDSTVDYYYDNKGYLIARELLNAAGNSLHYVIWPRDELSRVSSKLDWLGTHNYTYTGSSERMEQRVLSDQYSRIVEDFGYTSSAEGGRLQSLERRIDTGAPFVSYAYDHYADDNLKSITQTRAAEPSVETRYRYDAQLRLTHAESIVSGSTDNRYEYAYDRAGNRISVLSGEYAEHWSVDAANRLRAQAGLGQRRVVGTVSKPSHVKINGDYVPVDDNLRFEGFVDTLSTRDVTIEATDISGNVTTENYRFAKPQNTQANVYTHDPNGNLIEVENADGITRYTWDALDRLIGWEQLADDEPSGLRKEYHYDPVGRLSRIDTEDWDGVTWQPRTTQHYVFAGLERLLQRGADGLTSQKAYFEDGFIDTENGYLYGRDHLGSVVELLNAITGEILAIREYTPYGRIRTEEGTKQADFAWTGHFYDVDTGLHHAPGRVYDAALGRWLSADPYPDAELLPEGTNLYAYVGNDPINYIDLLGFCRSSKSSASSGRPPPPTQNSGSGTGGGKPPKKTASSASSSDGGSGNFGDISRKISNLIKGSKPGRATRGKTRQFDRQGGMNQANKDFDSLNPSNVRNIQNGGRAGNLSDGSKVNVRPNSKDGRPTLEILKGKNRIKFRFND